MLDKQGYTHTLVCTRSRARAHARTRSYTHTQICNIYLFLHANNDRERTSLLRYTYIACLAVIYLRVEPRGRVKQLYMNTRFPWSSRVGSWRWESCFREFLRDSREFYTHVWPQFCVFLCSSVCESGKNLHDSPQDNYSARCCVFRSVIKFTEF